MMTEQKSYTNISEVYRAQPAGSGMSCTIVSDHACNGHVMHSKLCPPYVHARYHFMHVPNSYNYKH